MESEKSKRGRPKRGRRRQFVPHRKKKKSLNESVNTQVSKY